MQSGAAYGFTSTLLAAALIAHGIATAVFFAPFAVVVALVRFVGMHRLQRLPPPGLAALGVGASLLGLALVQQPIAARIILAGMLIGLGYALILPACVEWASRRAEGKRLVALINTAFNLGAITAIALAWS